MIYGKFVKYVLFPLAQQLQGSGALEFLRQWEQTQWLPAEQLRQLQIDALRNVLEHCAASVPFYRETFRNCGFEPGDLKSLDDLAGLPVLDKPLLRERTRDFIAEGITEKLHTAKTGGSTGEPLSFPVGSSLSGSSAANMARCRRWWDIDVGDPSANFWGHSRCVRGRAVDEARRFLSLVKGRILNRIVCNAYDMSDEAMDVYWRRIKAFKPAFLIGYATSLYVFADFVMRRGREGKSLGLKAVISTAEVLYDWQAQIIRDAFGCPVVNEYGMCEAGIIAYECPSGSMHVMDESVVVEILPVEGSLAGEIVVTELENPAAPLIRYNTHDMASRITGVCACGRGLSRISAVEGRAYDVIYASDGKAVAGALLTHLMKGTPGVGRYQILQRDLGTLEITYVESSPVTAGDKESIVRTLKTHLGAGVGVKLARVDDIPRESSGKHRWLRSLVTGDDARRAREARK